MAELPPAIREAVANGAPDAGLVSSPVREPESAELEIKRGDTPALLAPRA